MTTALTKPGGFSAAIANAALTSGHVALDDLVSHRFALHDINEAFAMAASKPPGFVKATIGMEAG